MEAQKPVGHAQTMRAVFWEGKTFDVSVKTVPKPKILEKEDAIVRITSTSICGSDLHTYRGHLGSSNPPWGLGHEGMGIVTAIGDSTSAVKVGDRVVISDLVDDGHINLQGPTQGDEPVFGFGDEFGKGLGGCQAEYVRVPQADHTLIPIPADAKNELDFLFLSDIWCTAWTGLTWSGFEAGDTVAVYGAGPVGLLCAYSAVLRGASKVYIVDHNKKRLEKGTSIGAIPINFTHRNAAEQILALQPGGVTRAVDCVGQECLGIDLKPQQDAVLKDLTHVTAAHGGIGILGVYLSETKAAGRPLAQELSASLPVNMTDMWSKNLIMRAGLVDPRPVVGNLLDLVKNGRAKPSFIVSSVLHDIEEMPEAYRKFNAGEESKIVFRFPESKED